MFTRAAAGAMAALALGQWTFSQSNRNMPGHVQHMAKDTGLNSSSSTRLQPPIQPQGLSQLSLTGVAQFGAEKFAFLVLDESGKPPQYYKLTEGEQREGIEVVSIQVASGSAIVRHQGVEMLLSFAARKRARNEAELEEERFHQEHERAHELHETLQREREDREQAKGIAQEALEQPKSTTAY